MSRAKIEIRRSAKQADEYKRTVDIYVDRKLCIKVSWVNGPPYLNWVKC